MATLFSIAAPVYQGVKSGERTEISNAIAIAGTTLAVKNTQGFSANDYIVLGELGTEVCEVVQVTSVDSDTQLTVGATKFAHSVNDPVVKTLFNQVRFYRSSTAGGSYALETTVDMEVDNPDLETVMSTTTASARTLFWKITYFNSTNSNESSLDDSEPIQPSAETVYCTVGEVGGFLNLVIGQSERPLYSDVLEGIRAVTQMIDVQLNTSFRQTTYSDEVHDGNLSVLDRDYYVSHVPVVSVSSVATTQSAEGDSSPVYDSLSVTEDYVLDSVTGRISILDSGFIPLRGRRDAFKITYDGGASAVPNDIRRLAVLMVARQLQSGVNAKTIVRGRQGSDRISLDALNAEIGVIMRSRRVRSIGSN